MTRAWTSVNGFWIPVGIRIVIGLRPLQRLNRFVIVDERVATLSISDKAGNNASDCIWTVSEVASNGIGDFVQQDARWVDYAKATNDRHVLRQNVLCVCSGMQKSALIAESNMSIQ